MSIQADAHELSPDLAHIRHTLHERPEIGLDLPRTQETVLTALAGLPLDIRLGSGLSSITAVLRGTGGTVSHAPGTAPTVLLRADMDGLPVQERTGLPYASRTAGTMHACGHDLHTTMLIGAAQLLSARAHTLPGDVVLMFQPGEEGYDGAGHMIREGVLDASGRRADAAFGMHVFSSLEPHGTFVTKPGVMLSASAELSVTVLGMGGHGSAPHAAKDPVPAMAQMISALQIMVTREFDAFDPVVVTVGLVRAGTANNVIPDTAHFAATVRAFSEAHIDALQRTIPRLLSGIASGYGLEVLVEYAPQYPVTETDTSETEFAEGVIRDLFGDSRQVRMAQPLSGSEDFSRVLAEVPGSFIGLGAAEPDADYANAAFNHSPFATFSDGVLADGAALYAELASARLTALAGAASGASA